MIVLFACGGGGGGSTDAPVTPPVTSTYTISGKTTLNGAGLSGVTISLAGASTTSATTDASGNYAFSGAQNGSYTVTPSLTGYTFSPTSKSITVSGANLTGQDFTATRTNSNEITIKGSFTGTNAKSTWLNRIYAWFIPKAYALNPSLVARVLVFSAGNNSYTSANVTNGTFSINVERGSPVGMIFVDSNDTYMGYLSLSNGIDSIPLTRVANGVSTIDLQTISSSGLIMSPGHNPLGTELPLSSAEQTAIAQCNGMFASVIRNPDVDGNGIIDILENKFYRQFIAYGINAGNFNGNYTPTINSTVTMQYYNVTISSGSTTDSGGAMVTGPTGSGITNVTCSEWSPFWSIYPDLGTSPTPIPAAGEYKFTLSNGKVLTFSIPEQSQASSRIAVAIPTVSLNGDGTINKINWVYRMPNDSSSNLTPTALIQNIIIQINDAAHTMPRLYDSASITSDTTEHILTNQGIIWTNVNNISMAYNDVYGNHYVVDFVK
jgi:hypothetical protein